jgi:hypothetical protein
MSRDHVRLLREADGNQREVDAAPRGGFPLKVTALWGLFLHGFLLPRRRSRQRS